MPSSACKTNGENKHTRRSSTTKVLSNDLEFAFIGTVLGARQILVPADSTLGWLLCAVRWLSRGQNGFFTGATAFAAWLSGYLPPSGEWTKDFARRPVPETSPDLLRHRGDGGGPPCEMPIRSGRPRNRAPGRANAVLSCIRPPATAFRCARVPWISPWARAQLHEGRSKSRREARAWLRTVQPCPERFQAKRIESRASYEEFLPIARC